MKRAVELQPFTREDFERLIKWSGDPEFLMTWAGPWFKHPLDEQQLEKYISTSETSPPVSKIWKAVLTEKNFVFGHIELTHIDSDNETATLSRILVGDERLRGKGLGSAMIAAAIDEAFNTHGLHRIHLFVIDTNETAIKCYKKLGFEIEGHMKEYRKVGDERWSLFQMSLFARDWKNQERR